VSLVKQTCCIKLARMQMKTVGCKLAAIRRRVATFFGGSKFTPRGYFGCDWEMFQVGVFGCSVWQRISVMRRNFPRVSLNPICFNMNMVCLTLISQLILLQLLLVTTSTGHLAFANAVTDRLVCSEVKLKPLAAVKA